MARWTHRALPARTPLIRSRGNDLGFDLGIIARVRRRGDPQEIFLEEVAARERRRRKWHDGSKRADGASARGPAGAISANVRRAGQLPFFFFCRTTEHRHRQIDIYSRSAAVPRFPTAAGRPRAVGVTDTPAAPLFDKIAAAGNLGGPGKHINV